MSTMFLANAAAGPAGYFVGRMYRNEHEYRRRYRERANVGGFFGSILNSSEFDLFLSLLCLLVVLHVLQSHITTAPVTSCAILLMMFVHFQDKLLSQDQRFLTAENYHAYSFHPQLILDGQWYRLLTGPLLHRGHKLQLYLNMTALAMLCKVETNAALSVFGYTAFFVGLVITSGIAYMYCMKMYQQQAFFNSYRAAAAGFSGVVFALKCYHNTTSGVSSSCMRFPLAGDLYSYSIPMAVPAFAEHFVELFFVSVLFGNDVPFWAHVGGILAGYMFVALEIILVVLGISNPWMTNRSSASSEYDPYSTADIAVSKASPAEYAAILQQTLGKVVNQVKENAILVVLLALSIAYIYGTMTRREKELQRRLVELQEREQNESLSTKSPSLHDDVPREIPIKDDADSAGQSSWSLANEQGVVHDSQTKEDCKAASVGDSIYEDCSVSVCDKLPPQFNSSLKLLCTVTEKQDRETIKEALQMIQKILTNAVTKGQSNEEGAAKYRRIRLANPRVRKCNVDGAFETMLAVGFEIRQDLNDEKWLVYPKRENPDWMPAALEAIKVQLEALLSVEQESADDQMKEVKRRMRAAALQRQAASKRKKKKARESRYTAGMGGGDSMTMFYRGGT